MMFKANECSCPDCVSMCKNSPCIPIFHEVESMLRKGIELIPTLVFEAIDGKSYIVLAPEGKQYVDKEGIQRNQCVYLVDGKCAIHKHKPFEGKIMSCKNTLLESMVLRKNVLETWK